jgi:hypothetical protein
MVHYRKSKIILTYSTYINNIVSSKYIDKKKKGLLTIIIVCNPDTKTKSQLS